MLVEKDLRRLYAKINAQDVLLRVCLRAIANLADDPVAAFESLRVSAMEVGDTLRKREDEPNPEFADQGRLEALSFIAEAFR